MLHANFNFSPTETNKGISLFWFHPFNSNLLTAQSPKR